MQPRDRLTAKEIQLATGLAGSHQPGYCRCSHYQRAGGEELPANRIRQTWRLDAARTGTLCCQSWRSWLASGARAGAASSPQRLAGPPCGPGGFLVLGGKSCGGRRKLAWTDKPESKSNGWRGGLPLRAGDSRTPKNRRAHSSGILFSKVRTFGSSIASASGEVSLA